MSDVYILTNNGWVDVDYCKGKVVYALSEESLQNQVVKIIPLTVDSLKDVSSYPTYDIYNRYSDFHIHLNQQQKQLIQTNGQQYDKNYQLIDVNFLVSNYYNKKQYFVNTWSYDERLNKTRSTRTQRDVEKDVKLRKIDLEDFNQSNVYCSNVLSTWNAVYNRLIAVDYNAASMLQLLVTKTGFASNLTQNQGFEVLYEKYAEYLAITDIVESKAIKIKSIPLTRNQTEIHGIYNVMGTVYIG